MAQYTCKHCSVAFSAPRAPQSVPCLRVPREGTARAQAQLGLPPELFCTLSTARPALRRWGWTRTKPPNYSPGAGRPHKQCTEQGGKENRFLFHRKSVLFFLDAFKICHSCFKQSQTEQHRPFLQKRFSGKCHSQKGRH